VAAPKTGEQCVQRPLVPFLLFGPTFFYDYNFLVHYPVNRDDRLLAHAMASDFSRTGINVMITIFCNFWRKNWRISWNPMLWLFFYVNGSIVVQNRQFFKAKMF
jgi:hypothetical protein